MVINRYPIIWPGFLLVINNDFIGIIILLHHFNSSISSHRWSHIIDNVLMSDSNQIIPLIIVPINNIYDLMHILMIQLMDVRYNSALLGYLIY